MAQDWQMVEGEVSGGLHSTIDVQALIGALYLCCFANSSTILPVEKYNDICNFNRADLQFWRGAYSFFKPLPKLMPTPTMINFCNAFQAAHPTCCHQVGHKVIEWYLASIHLLGVADSLDYLAWKCKLCVSCKAAMGLQELLTAHKSMLDTYKQQLFDTVVRELVSLISPCSTGPSSLFLPWARQRLLLAKVWDSKFLS